MNTLVINLSLRSIRVIIFNDKSKKIYEDWLPVRTFIDGEEVEQDSQEWWKSLAELFQRVFSDSNIGPDIKYITVTSSASCLVCLDAKGQETTKVLMVSDKRAQSETAEIKEKFPKFFADNAHIKLEPGYMLPKILWLKNKDKKVFKKTKMFMSANDFLIWKLTGIFSTDTLNAEKFYFSEKDNSYPKELLKYIGISKSDLPKVVSPGKLIGKVSQGVSKKWNIKQDIEVVVSSYDAICALIGSSTYQQGELNNVCGTCSSYRFFSNSKAEIKGSLLLQELSQESIFITGASNNLEGGVLEWTKECFYGDSFLKDDSFLYQLMQTEAAESELGANGIIFLPYLLGERMPFFDPDVRGAFFGMERFHGRKDIVRSIFEAVNFQAKMVLEEFHKNGFEISFINMSGGVAKMPFAVQLRADVLGLPINVLEEVETTALGAYILSLRARGVIKSLREGASLVKVKKTYIPNMHNHNCYSSLFVLYKQLYYDHKEMFKKRREIFQKITHYRRQVLENL